MTRKIIITSDAKRIITGILEDDQMAELYCYGRDQDEKEASLGSIYIGKVKKIVTNINAAFIDIGGQECYYPLDPQTPPIFAGPSPKNNKLQVGAEVLVQIKKEAIKTKAPTVSSDLNLPGRYVILTAAKKGIGISRKITDSQRERLLETVQKYHSDEFGLIIRTNAATCPEAVIKQEIEALIDQYRQLMIQKDTRTCYSCLSRSEAPYIADIRNIRQTGLSEIVTDDPLIHQELQQYLSDQQPEDLDKLRLYQDDHHSLYQLYGISMLLEKLCQPKVWLPSGGFLVIEPTEALTVIDVNSGKFTKSSKSNPYLKVNLEAAREIARQIRLRNLSGIIIIDFINLDQKADQKELLRQLEHDLAADPIQTVLVDVTKLQLVEVTRKKVRRPLMESIQATL